MPLHSTNRALHWHPSRACLIIPPSLHSSPPRGQRRAPSAAPPRSSRPQPSTLVALLSVCGAGSRVCGRAGPHPPPSSSCGAKCHGQRFPSAANAAVNAAAAHKIPARHAETLPPTGMGTARRIRLRRYSDLNEAKLRQRSLR